MADTWKVVRHRNGREAVIFDGNEDDARMFLQNNYPRVHVEPGSPDSGAPDALLKSPENDYSAYHGPETGFVDTDEGGIPTDADDDNDDADDDDDDDVVTPPVKKTTAAKKTAARKTTAPAFGGTS